MIDGIGTLVQIMLWECHSESKEVLVAIINEMRTSSSQVKKTV